MTGYSKTATVLYIILIIAAGLHSFFALWAYLTCQPVQLSRVAPQQPFKMPAVTICSNVPVVQPSQQVPPIETHVNITGLKPIDRHNEMDILSKIALLDEQERYKISVPDMFTSIYDYLLFDDLRLNIDKNTKFQEWASFDSFNNLYYGNCFTFTPDRYNVISMGELLRGKLCPFNLTEMTITADHPYHRNGMKQQVDMPWANKIGVIHQQHTEPIFDSRFIIKGATNKKISITITKKEYFHEDDCISNNDYQPAEGYSRFSPVKRNYMHSLEACMSQCLQNLTITYCNCQLPQFYSTSKLPVCRGCRKIPKESLDEQCGCKHPCSYSVFETRTTEEQLFPERYNYVFDVAKYKSYGESEFSEPQRNELMKAIHRFKHERSQFFIGYKHPNVETIQLIACNFYSIFGQIGGILGLYIGISMAAIVEMSFDYLETFADYIKKLANKKKNKKSSDNTNVKSSEITTSSWEINSNGIHIKSTNNVTTSFPLIKRIQKASYLWKMFWTLLLIVGILVTILQTYKLFEEYFQYKVKRHQTMTKLTEFPAVTVCSNIMYHWTPEKAAQNNYTQKYQKEIEDFIHKSWKPHELPSDTQTRYLQESSDVRKELSIPANEYIKNCTYQSAGKEWIKCTNFVERPMGNFGNCATFNAGLLNSNTSSVDNPTGLKMELKFNILQYWQVIETYGITVIIHTKGVSFNKHPNTMITIKPGEHVDITFSTTKNQRLPYPYESDCVDEYSPEFQWKNLFHDNDFQYIYTYDSCMVSCAFNHTDERWPQLLVTVPKYMGRRDIKNFVLVHPKTGGCMDLEYLDKCNCKTPCSDTVHGVEFKSAMDSNWTVEDAYENIVRAANNSEELRTLEFTLFPKSYEMEVITEKPALNIVDILAEVGGILGLWIGASILSIIELKSTIISKFFKPKTNDKIL